ncbi:calcyclin-binding protein [Vespula maculifrons]|uniref:Calcyclin-binding protein n=1 Tax=Vespula maculifrons TaxID=7453 RepID=A0ABD2B5K6_VESMC
MATKSDELKLDIEELNTLLQQATRSKVKNMLTLEIRRLQTEVAKLIDENKDVCLKSVNSSIDSIPKCYEVKLNNYGWDQTNSVVKIYVQLKNVHTLPNKDVTCKYTEKSMDLYIFGLDNKNYHLPINNLCEDIDTQKSYVKIKTDMIIVYLAKKLPKNWSHVTGVEKRIKEAKTPSVPDMGDDPGASLVNLMKKMYQDGDDEMKKTIAKAWTENQQKTAAGLSGFDY